MDRFYGMSDGRTLCGMDDAGEMSSWYVFNAIGIYPYSPADAQYIVTVPLFDQVELNLNDKTVTIARTGEDPKISEIECNGKKLAGYFVSHGELIEGQRLTIKTSHSIDAK
jgi:putative alpha-1,2-mannosidase